MASPNPVALATLGSRSVAVRRALALPPAALPAALRQLVRHALEAPVIAATQSPRASQAQAPAPAAGVRAQKSPSGPLSPQVSRGLSSILKALVATGDPRAYALASTILYEEHKAVMAGLEAWGESLRAQAKLSAAAHLKLQRQVRHVQRVLKQRIDRSPLRQIVLRGARGLRPAHFATVNADTWNDITPEVLGLGTYAERYELRPGLAPTPPLPRADAGGFRLRASRFR